MAWKSVLGKMIFADNVFLWIAPDVLRTAYITPEGPGETTGPSGVMYANKFVDQPFGWTLIMNYTRSVWWETV